ncbi:MAG: RIP metalloprotease RseP [Bacteroidetes bacterium]|nr:RIP metalloprotease RseP [Bacteroidota bacterium]
MLIKTVQLLLSLSILVIIHELGHFLAARAFKTRVEKFYLFFDFLFPIPTLLNFALFKKKIGDTEYGIGWFPLGGYVKIAGMIDESMDETFLASEPKPDEYRSKKNYQKLIIMLGGIIMNLILGWLIYSQLSFWQGEAYLPAENAKYGISCDSVAMYAGFRDGDVILSHDGGTKFASFQSVPKEILLDGVKKVEILRNGEPFTISIPADFVKVVVASRAKNFIDFRIPCMVGEFSEESVIKDKLKKGDIILSINDSTVHYFQEAKGILANFIGTDVTIKFLRGKDTLTTSVKVPVTGLLGFRSPSDMHDLKGYMDIVETKYGFFASFAQGGKLAYHRLTDYLKQLKLMFNPDIKAYKQIGGMGTIGSLFPATWDWVAFWQLTAFISIMLAVANLLPIPMLDGGYVLLLLFEMITRKKVSDQALEYINRVGFVIVIVLIVYANGMDIYRALLGK